MPLAAGSIAFVGYNGDGNDNLAFVALEDIAAGEIIYFEDNEWNGSGWVDTNEGAVKWTASSSVAAGTIVRIDNIGIGTITASTGTVVDASLLSPSRGTNRGIGAADEIIYAYQGSAASPTFITAIASGGFNATNGLLTGTGLTAGVNALDLSTLDDDADIAAFNGLRNTQTTFAEYLPIINNPANWIAQDGAGNQSIDSTAPDVPFSSTAFTLNVVASGITLTQTSGTTIVTEGGTTDSYTIVLNSQPTADVAIAVISNSQLTTSAVTLTFTPNNWNVAQNVTVTAVDDVIVEGSHSGEITHSVTSTDAQYNNIIINPIVASITDNDKPTVNLAVSSNTTSEAGRNQITVTATASEAVSGNQSITLNVEGADITPSDYYLSTVSTGLLTIPNGQTTATATFFATDDAKAEGTETAVLRLSAPSSGISLGTTTTQNITITNNSSSVLTKVSGFTSSNGSEITAFDPISDRLFVVAGSVVEILNLSNPASPSKIGDLAFNTSGDPDGTTAGGFTLIPNSVAVGKAGTVSDGIVAVAIAITNQTTADDNPGEVQFFNATTGAFISKVNVGFLPDMLTFTPDGTKVLTANEGQPNNAYTTDPVGSVSIIDLAGGIATPTIQEASFTTFNSQIIALKASGVRIFGPGSSVAQDLEPEYIAFSGDGTKAWVTLQENSAIAVVDIATATVGSILPLGFKDYTNGVNTTNPNVLDASDRDVNGSSNGGGKIAIQNWPVFGMYQPDAIASYTVNGQTYYVTANEGDARDYTGFKEEVSVSSLNLDPTAFSDGATLKLNQNLGRLLVTNTLGDTDGDGDYDQIYTFGARSFTIWDSAGNRVYDSGADFERITAAALPKNFNSNNDSNNFDNRSDNKGPEPEGVVIGAIANRIYAFIGLERVGGVMVYEVTNPNSPQFIQYVNTRDFSLSPTSGVTDSGPEGLTFISANDSPTGKPLLITANEISKTVAVFEIQVSVDHPTASAIWELPGTNPFSVATWTGSSSQVDGSTPVQVGGVGNTWTTTDAPAGSTNQVVLSGQGNILNVGTGSQEIQSIGQANLIEAVQVLGDGAKIISTGSFGGGIQSPTPPAVNAAAPTVGNVFGQTSTINEMAGGMAPASGFYSYVTGGTGNDQLYGSIYSDFFRGGMGNDTIFAYAGNDIVRGGAGSDQMTLGPGNDTIYYTFDQLQNGDVDTVTDFNAIAGDVDILAIQANRVGGASNYSNFAGFGTNSLSISDSVDGSVTTVVAQAGYQWKLADISFGV